VWIVKKRFNGQKVISCLLCGVPLKGTQQSIMTACNPTSGCPRRWAGAIAHRGEKRTKKYCFAVCKKTTWKTVASSCEKKPHG
jgi:hypothetical protein